MEKEEIAYAKKNFRLVKSRLFLGLTILVFLMVLMGLLLNKHLFKIQGIERLEKLKDYSEFRLELQPKENCTMKDKLIYQNDEMSFYTTCLNEVYVIYGTTPTTLQNALTKGYIDMDLLTDNAILDKFEDYQKYTFKVTANPKERYVIYVFTVDNHQNIYITSL